MFLIVSICNVKGRYQNPKYFESHIINPTFEVHVLYPKLLHACYFQLVLWYLHQVSSDQEI